ncbi:hypothetical protein PoB_003441700 [Plakobranchus ocellatus]|uniref:Uncharacterized protein n=1 Tax=Plakobranchus ocellatus TaxID=259542 RepID=A0AAV4AKY9_9GAST|nr:hypothetical protein PoB_003441700 [Plakobranchus ocellatus]
MNVIVILNNTCTSSQNRVGPRIDTLPLQESNPASSVNVKQLRYIFILAIFSFSVTTLTLLHSLNKATDVRPGCKTQRIAPTLRQVADLVCTRTKEREYFKTCIVGHVNCCLQCGPT